MHKAEHFIEKFCNDQSTVEQVNPISRKLVKNNQSMRITSGG